MFLFQHTPLHPTKKVQRQKETFLGLKLEILASSVANVGGHECSLHTAVYGFTLQCTCARVHSGMHSCLYTHTHYLPSGWIVCSCFCQNKMAFVLTHSFRRDSTSEPSYLRSNIHDTVFGCPGHTDTPRASILEVNSGHVAVGGLHF